MIFPNIYTNPRVLYDLEVVQTNVLFNNDVANYLGRAYDFAQKIIYPSSNFEPKGPVNVTNGLLGRPYKSFKNFTFIMAIDSELGKREEIAEEMEKIQDFRDKIKHELIKDPQHLHLIHMKEVVDIQRHIFKILEGESDWWLILLITTVAGSALMALGTFVNSPGLTFGGLIIGLVTIVTIAVSELKSQIWGVTASKVIRATKKMERHLHDLSNANRFIPLGSPRT